jgi:hypothetical protein
MGGTSSVVKAEKATTLNESGGLHLVEFHLASASFGVGTVIFVILIALLTFAIAWYCLRRCRRPTPTYRGHGRAYPGSGFEMSPMVAYSAGLQHASTSFGHLGPPRPKPPTIHYDNDRFVSLPRSATPTGPPEHSPGTPDLQQHTASAGPPPTVDQEWVPLRRSGLP